MSECRSLPYELFGFSLGPMDGGTIELWRGLEHEGTAELIRGVGFLLLNGESRGIEFDKVMVHVDRGSLIGFGAVGHVAQDEDQGFARIKMLIETVSGQAMTVSGETAKLECANGDMIEVRPILSEGGQALVHISYKDPRALASTKAYIDAYCADPSRRRPQDACN